MNCIQLTTALQSQTVTLKWERTTSSTY